MLCDLGGAAPLSTRVHMHACMHSHCLQLQTSDFDQERQAQNVDDCIPVNAVVLNEITWCTLQEE